MKKPAPRSKVESSLDFIASSVLDSSEEKLLALIHQGWEAFYREMFGDQFVDGLDSIETNDTFHTDAIDWHWNARLALLNNETPPEGFYTYFPTWPRGFGKTTLGRCMLITDAMLTYAHGQKGYALIAGGTNKKVQGTAKSIEMMLHDPVIKKWCPDLSRVSKNTQGRSRGWTADFLSTEAGYVFHFIGLDEGIAGANVDGVRPTFICLDDIDDRTQSPVIAENRFTVLTSEVLPTGQPNTLFYWAQNLINRFSVRYRIEKQHAKVLVHRKLLKPVPAVRNAVYEQRTVDGMVKNIIVAGEVTWRRKTLTDIQKEIDTIDLPAFLREQQHEVEASTEGLLLHNWRDDIHVISISEFEAATGYDRMPAHWPKEWVNDWARTKTRYHANVAFWRTVSPQNAKLPGFTFIFDPMSFPANSQPEDVAERLLSCLELGPLGQEREKRQKTWSDVRKDELVRADALEHTKTTLDRITFERQAIAEIFPAYVEAVIKKHHVLGGCNSHERDDIRLIYNRVFGLKCTGVNPKKYGGIEEINRAMSIDPHTDHPVRPNVKGYTRFFVVVPDWKKAPEETLRKVVVAGTNGERKELTVYPPAPFTDSTAPEELHDDELWRFQMVNWKTRPSVLTVTGEIVDDPEKANDDFGNGLQMAYVKGPLRNPILTLEEEVEMLIPEHLRPRSAVPMTRSRQHEIESATYFARAQLEEKYGETLEDLLEPEDYEDSFYQ